jgi:hypothetical protein
VASCSSQAYNGPDAGSVGRSGVCSDKAGNTSAAVAFDFRYDATAPRGLAVSRTASPTTKGGTTTRSRFAGRLPTGSLGSRHAPL